MPRRPRTFKHPPAAGTTPRPGPPRPEVASPAPLGDAARDAALRTIAHAARRFPDLPPAEIDDRGLSPTDAALARAIVGETVRRWLLLSYLLAPHSHRPIDLLEPRLRAVLLGGAAQLALLDRLPAHAVINHAVEWAKRRIRPGAGGMTNALLRKVAASIGDRRERWSDAPDQLPLSDGRAVSLVGTRLPDDEWERLAIITGIGEKLLARWRTSFGDAGAREFALHSLVEPPTILNTRHLGSPLPADAAVEPHTRPGHAVWTGGHGALVRLLGDRSDVWVQDPASSAAIESVADLTPALIVDACAGRGTKTRQLRHTFPRADIVATDPHTERFADLARAFAGDPRITVAPHGTLIDNWAGKADLILLDVPCSNTGVLARRPEARYRFSDESLADLNNLQRQIIADSIPLLSDSPRAAILYSTCSLEPEENRGIAEWARTWHGYRFHVEHQTPPTGIPGGPPQRYNDGSYSVLLMRR